MCQNPGAIMSRKLQAQRLEKDERGKQMEGANSHAHRACHCFGHEQRHALGPRPIVGGNWKCNPAKLGDAKVPYWNAATVCRLHVDVEDDGRRLRNSELCASLHS